MDFCSTFANLQPGASMYIIMWCPLFANYIKYIAYCEELFYVRLLNRCTYSQELTPQSHEITLYKCFVVSL